RWLSTTGAADRARLAALRDELESGIVEAHPGARISGAGAPHGRLWNTSHLALPGVESEALLMMLSESGDGGVCASAGSACSSGSLVDSDVTVDGAMAGRLRLSLSRLTTPDEARAGLAAIIACLDRLV
ncbi:MAG: cysteine desulfurase NifS, partial [Phycisphaerales bacterium]|nr:cysteine desulfurase NifS [Phycisphaerales bacterium]